MHAHVRKMRFRVPPALSPRSLPLLVVTRGVVIDHSNNKRCDSHTTATSKHQPRNMNRKPSFGLLSLAKSTSQLDKSSTTSQPPERGPKYAREPGTADKPGWRKKFHAGRPKTPLPVNVAEEEPNVTDDAARRQHLQTEKAGWRKTIQGSRPATPVTTPASISVEEDGDDARSEQGLELANLHRRSDPAKPNYKRHWSNYITITSQKEQIFSEPWGTDSPPLLRPPVDPLMVLQVCPVITTIPHKTCRWKLQLRSVFFDVITNYVSSYSQYALIYAKSRQNRFPCIIIVGFFVSLKITGKSEKGKRIWRACSKRFWRATRWRKKLGLLPRISTRRRFVASNCS